jgi:hypothetical protein
MTDAAVAGLIERLSDDELLWLPGGDVPVPRGALAAGPRVNAMRWQARRTFEIHDLRFGSIEAERIRVIVKVKNTGPPTGREIVQNAGGV